MIDISIKNAVKAFVEGENVLDGVSIDVNAGEHVGLLGANGAGKTTLFRLIIGELETDEGDVAVSPSKKIGLISQIPVYPEAFTAEDVLRSAFDSVHRARERMDALTLEMETSDSRELLREYDVLAEQFEHGGGYAEDYEVNRVANGLKIPAGQRAQPFSTLSGGEKTRVNLARLILEDTDILLLDEPTNHLDIHAVEWLEEYLSKFKGTALIISHDRYFLDRAVRRTIELTRGKAELYSGGYTFYVKEKQRRRDEQRKKYESEQTEIARLEATARRMRSWATEKAIIKAKAVETRIERIRDGGVPRPEREKSLRGQFSEREFKGDMALAIKGLSKALGGKTLFSGISAEVLGGERIALLGDNGCGKTTLLRVLLGEEKRDAGMIKFGPAVRAAYLPQLVSFQSMTLSALDTVIYETKCSPQTARNRLGAFKFSGNDVFKLVGEMSGGERSRLRLCILMSADINFLILDEPTNHLDIPSREWIEDAVAGFEGTLLFVSHDRYFTEKFATRVWELEGGAFHDHRCGFNEYQELKSQEFNAPPPARDAQPVKPQARTRQNQRELREAARAATRLEREIAELERRLAALEAERAERSSDYKRLLELDAEQAPLDAELDEKLREWEAVTENFML
ncbi:MAG: ABC-F family ATP-binding cassette domain-containing protein [Oscillospiraceae bacterium]|nr:ABC-F family ATP-binding cassette domain-containing protein [Oscillospiraceae bacterium]